MDVIFGRRTVHRDQDRSDHECHPQVHAHAWFALYNYMVVQHNQIVSALPESLAHLSDIKEQLSADRPGLWWVF